ncbi:MAG TPA: alpha/beta hydrolase [Gaiellaceae bacterium]|jgi:pimeloyl-ACP methyl ester carboxylesterase|nr:alpha/beta hydrolase [Gaiellaceae bacterium]
MSHVLSRDNTVIAYDRVGEGPSLVIVEGALVAGRTNHTAGQLAEALASRFTVYTYDRRGRGDSGDTGPYSVALELDDLDAVISEGGGEAFVFGVSAGAVLALDAAARGSAIKKLAVYGAPFIVDDSRPPVPNDYLARLNERLAANRRGDAVELFFAEAIGMPAERIAGMRSQPFWVGLERVAHTLAYDGAILGDTTSGRPLPSARWSRITVPTLVIDGGASDTFIHTAAEALANNLAQARRLTLPDQTQDYAADTMAPALVEFFSETSTTESYAA